MRGEDWCGSSAWLEYLPVTQGVAGSSPVRTAKKDVPNNWSSFYCFSTYTYNLHIQDILYTFALIGNPISHSKSPAMFKAAYSNSTEKELQESTYTLIQKADIIEALTEFLNGSYNGINITAPFKEQLFSPRVADLFKDKGYSFLPDKITSFLHCANILVKDEARKALLSYNSDFMGVKAIIQTVGKQKKLNQIAVFGAGGAGKAAAMAVVDCNLELSLINRSNVSGFCNDINSVFCMENQLPPLASYYSIDDYKAISLILSRTDMVIYTIPKETGNIRNLLLERPLTLLEANYANPAFSTLYKESNLYISGKEWLLQQAVPAFKIFTGVEPSVESMRDVLNC